MGLELVLADNHAGISALRRFCKERKLRLGSGHWATVASIIGDRRLGEVVHVQ